MKFKTLLITAFIGTILPFSALGQSAEQFNAWYMYFGNHTLSDKLSLHTEYQFRRSGFISDWQQSLARIGLDVKLTDQSMATGGYGYIVSYPYGEQPIAFTFNEHRIWQQLSLNQRLGGWYLNHRYRLEQRFLQNVTSDIEGNPFKDGYRFRQRARYRLLASIPLSRKTMEDHTLFLSLYDEVFLGFGKGVGPNILDQNRLFAALGWRFNSRSNVQLGYLYHCVFKSDGVSRENNHTLQAAFTHNMDFRASK